METRHDVIKAVEAHRRVERPHHIREPTGVTCASIGIAVRRGCVDSFMSYNLNLDSPLLQPFSSGVVRISVTLALWR